MHRYLYLVTSLAVLAMAVQGGLKGTLKLRGGIEVRRSENPIGYWLLMLLYLGSAGLGFVLTMAPE